MALAPERQLSIPGLKADSNFALYLSRLCPRVEGSEGGALLEARGERLKTRTEQAKAKGFQ